MWARDDRQWAQLNSSLCHDFPIATKNSPLIKKRQLWEPPPIPGGTHAWIYPSHMCPSSLHPWTLHLSPLPGVMPAVSLSAGVSHWSGTSPELSHFHWGPPSTQMSPELTQMPRCHPNHWWDGKRRLSAGEPGVHRFWTVGQFMSVFITALTKVRLERQSQISAFSVYCSQTMFSFSSFIKNFY